MIRLAIGGSRGRMGRRIESLAEQDDRFQLSARVDVDDPDPAQPYDVLIDFSVPAGTMRFLPMCCGAEAALVIGCTGHSPEEQARIQQAGTRIAILQASNFSLGVNLLLKHLPTIGHDLRQHFDVEIVETHHTAKVDAPSGTAYALLKALLDTPDDGSRDQVVFGRQGRPGRKPKGEIGIHAVRSGDIVGHHQVIFGGIGESITITHDARSRDTFARGALEAAAWIHGKPPGLYHMQQVLS